MSFNKKLIIIAFVGTLLAITWQEINSSYLNETESLRFGMIQTADEASYLAPPKNFLSNGVWADNSDGITRFYQRSPGYGSIYLICKVLFGKYALLGLKVIQIIGYFLSILLIGKIALKLLPTDKIALLTALVAATLPMFSGFMYYTLTEGITPLLTLWSIHSYINYDKNKKPFQLIVSTAILILVRPQLVLLPLLFIIFHLLKKEWKQSLFITLAFLPFFLWQMRTYSISSEFPGLHPIYSKENNTLYRPSHEVMTDLFRIWESDGAQFHSAIAAINNSTISIAMVNIPSEIQVKVKPVFIEYERLLNAEYSYSSAEYTAAEIKFITKTQGIIKQLKKENKYRNIIETPLKSAHYLLSKSQMNLFIFQEPWRGNFFIESLRIASVLLINLGFLAALWILLRFKLDRLTIIAGFSILSLFYLIYIQRLNEERYLTPLLPLLLICLLYVSCEIKELLQALFLSYNKRISS